MNRLSTSLLAALAAALLLLPLWANSGLVFLAGTTIIVAVFALSWNLLFGYAGLASFGSGGLFSIGAYTMAVMLRQGYEGQFLLLIVLATLAGGTVAFAIGLVALRRSSGIFLAILTLALAELLRISLAKVHWLGAEDGIPSIVRPAFSVGFATVDLSRGNSYYWFLCIACALLVALTWWIAHGRFGRTLRTIRLDVERAAFMGVDTHRYRLVAFTISGAIAACAGSLFAPWAQIVTPDIGNMMRSTQPILFTLLGGASSFWGPLIGAFLFSAIEFSTRTLVGIQEIITGGILLVVVLMFPTGVAGAWNALIARLSVRQAPEKAATAAPASEGASQ
ncbi:branched-chain amino acid ABC transporter permease [Aminobacter sp. HY435]|uniref:branched-chain amino acid ABC transporter permease n=1 Tax=Aminobacter sp. HY435 TaxID=2970917 RepID=UPI0022B98100|nr:branched-chain amino acid ABC transporter permease [Aminobacter sp. HY435]